MQRVFTLAIVAVGLVGLYAAGAAEPAAEKERKPILLLGTLSEWMYPDSKLQGGATMSDGGHPREQSVKLQAVLTTPDPFEKVIEFYEEKFDIDEAAATPADEAKSVTVQDDSKDRPLALRVITVNQLDSTTTLVISRAKDEDQTHIAWLHYIRLGPKPDAG